MIVLTAVLVMSVLINSVFISFGEIEIVIIDIGQGDCIFVRSLSGKSYLIDCGSGNVNDIEKNRIVPFLKYKSVAELDFILISHTDKDHISGVIGLLENFEVGTVVMPDILFKEEVYNEIVEKAYEEGVMVEYFSKGDYIEDGLMKLACMHPPLDYGSTDSNSLSMVLQMKFKSFSALFTGDMTQKEEKLLVTSGVLDKIDLLKVAHHGSKFSTCYDFLEVIRPDIAVVSCSKVNSYGHPDPDVMERLLVYTDSIYVTSEGGAITLRTNGEEVRVQEFIGR